MEIQNGPQKDPNEATPAPLQSGAGKHEPTTDLRGGGVPHAEDTPPPKSAGAPHARKGIGQHPTVVEHAQEDRAEDAGIQLPTGLPPRTFTQEEVGHIAAKEAKRAERTLLRLFGCDNRGELEAALAKIEASAPGFATTTSAKNTECEQPRGLLSRLADALAERNTLQKETQALRAETQTLLREAVLRGAGVAQEALGQCATAVEAFAQEGQPFEEAAAAYFAANPLRRAQVATAPAMAAATPALTRADVLAIADTAKRLQLIADNRHLFER